MEYTFDARWFNGLNDKEREFLKSQLVADKKTLDKLREMLYNIVTSEDNVRFDDYESPSWSHKAAHRNGRLDAFNTILRLVTLDKEASPNG